jgi:hypothetical protein
MNGVGEKRNKSTGVVVFKRRLMFLRNENRDTIEAS